MFSHTASVWMICIVKRPGQSITPILVSFDTELKMSLQGDWWMTLLNMFSSKSLGTWVVRVRSPDNIAWRVLTFLNRRERSDQRKCWSNGPVCQSISRMLALPIYTLLFACERPVFTDVRISRRVRLSWSLGIQIFQKAWEGLFSWLCFMLLLEIRSEMIQYRNKSLQGWCVLWVWPLLSHGIVWLSWLVKSDTCTFGSHIKWSLLYS